MTIVSTRRIGRSEIELPKRLVKPAPRKPLTAKQRREMPYDEYLKTAYWAAKRRSALIRAGGRCQVCNSNINLHVHHRTYERRGCEHMADLTVLCCRCHKRHHLPVEPKS